MASRKSTSVAQSARRADRTSSARLGRYASQVAAELGPGCEGTVAELEAALADEKLVSVGGMVHTFVVDVKGRQGEREQREVLLEASFPPLI